MCVYNNYFAKIARITEKIQWQRRFYRFIFSASEFMKFNLTRHKKQLTGKLTFPSSHLFSIVPTNLSEIPPSPTASEKEKDEFSSSPGRERR